MNQRIELVVHGTVGNETEWPNAVRILLNGYEYLIHHPIKNHGFHESLRRDLQEISEILKWHQQNPRNAKSSKPSQKNVA